MKNFIPNLKAHSSRLFSFLLILFLVSNMFAQGSSTGDDNTNLPSVIPPSPTVASLMQFEEVPVSHYTGQPNISIPLYSKALSSELGISIALAYNTQGIKINSRSSWVGTGWSLEAGGVISRTVRGVADEKPKGDTEFPGNAAATGVFHNDDYWNYNDPNIVNQSKFAWRANGAQGEKYDYESDLFQFNALGITGRFVIVKEGTVLVPKLITKNQNIKIVIDYGPTSETSNIFNLNGFTIIDTKGNRYTFDQIEVVYSDPFTAVEYFGGNQSYQGQGTNGRTTNAWYLSKIETSNFKELARFDYQEIVENYVASINRTYREIVPDSTPSNWNNMVLNPYNPSVIPPKVSISYYTTTAHTQKLSKITFRDSTRVEFSTLSSHPETGGLILDKILIKDENLVENKRFTLDYDTTPDIDRLWLIGVKEKAGSLTHPYAFNYIDKEELPPFDTESDAWGYNNGMDNLNFNSSCNATDPFDKDVIKKGLLSSIKYPTGGVKEFIFEHNTITYQSKIGALGTQGTSNDTIAIALADNYYQKYNTDNWIIADPVPFIIDSDNDNYAEGPPYPQTNDFTLPQDTQIVFNINNMNVDLSQCGTGDTEENVLFNSLIKIIGTNVNYETNIRLSNLEQDQLILNLDAGTYEIRFYMLNDCARVTFDTCYNDITYEPIVSRFIYGGGVRIKEIVFKDDDDVNTLPSKKVSFAYNDELDPSRSSGAIDGDINGMNLVYIEEITKHLFKNEYTCIPSYVEEFQLFFNVFTKGLNVELTQGSYVGYKSVSVSEENNGSTRYTFTSPQDYANQTEVFNYPDPLPPKNLDYRRGLLLKKRVFKHNSTPQAPGIEPLGKLMETENTYKFIDELIAPSFRLYTASGCPWAMYFSEYDQYVSPSGIPQNRLKQCQGTVSGCDGDCYTTVEYQQKAGCTNTPYYLIQNPVESGWAQLKETKNTEYFNVDSTNPLFTESRQEFEYNNDNFQIKTQKSFYEEKGVEQEHYTEFVYPVDGLLITSNYGSNAIWDRLVDLNKINEVVITKTYKNTVLLSTTYTKYEEDTISNPDQVLPSSVETSIGNNIPEARVQFHKYDEYGNPLEMSKELGIHIIYVWGYNNTKPIAKIVGKDYISASLQTAIDAAKTASNNDTNLTNENILKMKLDAIRNHSSLEDAQVTTMTYDPLIGITSVTDARGYSMTYYYDDFNRLDHVKDKDGNILSKNEYNYKNQY